MKPDNNQSKELLTPNEVAALLGVDVETLNVWRATQRYGLPYFKIGKRLVRYKRVDVDAFIQSGMRH